MSHVNLKIAVFFAKGKRTCSKSMPEGEYCPFLGATGFGSITVCMPLSERVNYGSNGFIDPHERCPLNGLEVIE